MPLISKLSTPLHLLYIYQDDCGLMWGVLQAAGNPNAYDVTTWVRTCVEMLNFFLLRWTKYRFACHIDVNC